jgi:vacuolar protein 8
MLSPNVEVQCNAVGCITNLATHEDNKAKIARSGALGPLTRLAKSRDMRVQRNATGALLNMTHSGMATDASLTMHVPANAAQMRTGNNW